MKRYILLICFLSLSTNAMQKDDAKPTNGHIQSPFDVLPIELIEEIFQLLPARTINRAITNIIRLYVCSKKSRTHFDLNKNILIRMMQQYQVDSHKQLYRIKRKLTVSPLFKNQWEIRTWLLKPENKNCLPTFLNNQRMHKWLEYHRKRLELLNASKTGDLLKVKALILDGVDVNESDGKNDTPLIATCRAQSITRKFCITDKEVSNHIAIIKLLLSKGAEINLQNSKGDTALSVTITNGFEPFVRLLLEKGASVSIVHPYFGSSLAQTVSALQSKNDRLMPAYLKIIALLLQAKADPCGTAPFCNNKPLIELLQETKEQRQPPYDGHVDKMIALLKEYGTE